MNAKVGVVFAKSSRARSITQLSLMIAITMVTQVVAMYKSSIIAANFGASTELDAYNFSNNIASFFSIIVTSGIITVLVPAFVNKMKRSSIDSMISTVFLVTGLFLLLTFVFRGQIVDVLTDREDEFRDCVSRTMLFSILIQMLPAMLSVTMAYYQSRDKFNLPKIILMISNLAVAVVLSVYENFTIDGYLGILVGGAFFQFVVDVICAVFYGFRFRITFDLTDKMFREMCRLILPAVFGTGIYALNIMIYTMITSNLGKGQLTVLGFANTINVMINTLFIGNLSAYVFPQFIITVNEGRKQGQHALWGSIVVFNAVIGLIVAGFLIVGRDFVCLLYENGKFTADAADSVFYCMCIFIFSQQANVISNLIYKYFSAEGDTKSSMKNSLITCIFNIIMCLIFSYFWGVYGVVSGTLFSGLISVIDNFTRLKNKYGLVISIKPYLNVLLKTQAAILLTTVIVFLIKGLLAFSSRLVSVFLYGIIAILLFISNMYLLNTKILKLIAKVFPTTE